MPKFDVALLITVEAETYDDALKYADQLAEGIGMTEEISCSAVWDYERDNEGQRVLYLHDPIVQEV